MSAYILSPRALKDLFEIHDYIARDSTARADAYIQHLKSKIASLAKSPWLGKRREELTFRDFQFYSVRRHLVVYAPRSSPLKIVRIIHQARDVATQLDFETDA